MGSLIWLRNRSRDLIRKTIPVRQARWNQMSKRRYSVDAKWAQIRVGVDRRLFRAMRSTDGWYPCPAVRTVLRPTSHTDTGLNGERSGILTRFKCCTTPATPKPRSVSRCRSLPYHAGDREGSRSAVRRGAGAFFNSPRLRESLQSGWTRRRSVPPLEPRRPARCWSGSAR